MSDCFLVKLGLQLALGLELGLSVIGDIELLSEFLRQSQVLLSAVLINELLNFLLLEKVLLLSELSLQDLDLAGHGHVVQLHACFRGLQSEGFLV